MVQADRQENDRLVRAIRTLSLPDQDAPEQLFVDDVRTVPAVLSITRWCGLVRRAGTHGPPLSALIPRRSRRGALGVHPPPPASPPPPHPPPPRLNAARPTPHT